MAEATRTTGVDRIAGAFAGHGRRAALMPYLMGGFPDLEASRAIGLASLEAGGDLLELGIPFSDPLADGPLIHAAGTRALAAGVTPSDVLGVCETLAERAPVLLMVYANLVLAGGADRFVERADDAGAAGLIVPDLPHDEAAELRAACDARGLALVPLVAPTTRPDRLRAVGADARGFVYTVSLTGTTGERGELAPEQARRVADIADGVIVGSRLVRAAGDGGAPAVRDAVAELAAALA